MTHKWKKKFINKVKYCSIDTAIIIISGCLASNEFIPKTVDEYVK